MIKAFLLIGLGGAFGSMLRYLFSLRIRSDDFPYATLTVNIVGSLVIGLVMGLMLKAGDGLNNNTKLFLATGICGGFTTFSAFSLECIQMLEQQRYGSMLLYVGLSILLGLAATFAGIQLTRL